MGHSVKLAGLSLHAVLSCYQGMLYDVLCDAQLDCCHCSRACTRPANKVLVSLHAIKGAVLVGAAEMGAREAGACVLGCHQIIIRCPIIIPMAHACNRHGHTSARLLL